jgi:hypothetical protein
MGRLGQDMHASYGAVVAASKLLRWHEDFSSKVGTPQDTCLNVIISSVLSILRYGTHQQCVVQQQDSP